MKVNFGWQMLLILIAAAVAIYVFVKGKAVATKLVTQTLNPASDKNIVYGGVNTVVQAITDNKDATLGTAAYDSIHDDCGNLKWPWQASSPCTFPVAGKLPNLRTGSGFVPPPGVKSTMPAPIYRTFGSSEGE